MCVCGLYVEKFIWIGKHDVQSFARLFPLFFYHSHLSLSFCSIDIIQYVLWWKTRSRTLTFPASVVGGNCRKKIFVGGRVHIINAYAILNVCVLFAHACESNKYLTIWLLYVISDHLFACEIIKCIYLLQLFPPLSNTVPYPMNNG